MERRRKRDGAASGGIEVNDEATSHRSVRNVGSANSVSAKVGSSRLAIFEALAANDVSGAIIPEIIRASGVPKSTVHRVMGDFEERGLVVRVGRRRKAPLFTLNPADDEVVDVARALKAYFSWRTAAELGVYKRRELTENQRLRMMSYGQSKLPA